MEPRRITLGPGSIVGFLFLAAALYWFFVLLGVLPENPKAIALSLLLILVAAGVGRFGVGV